MVKDITTSATQSSSSSSPINFTQIGNQVFFSAYDRYQTYRLYRLDLAKKAAWPIQGKSSSPANLVNYGGTLFFSAQDTKGRLLCKIASSADAAANPTVSAGDAMMVKGFTSSYSNSQTAHSLVAGDNSVYYVGTHIDGLSSSQYTGEELWKSDGTAAGTVLVRDIRIGESSSGIKDPVWLNGRLYFWANDGAHGVELWISNGTTLGTKMIKDINAGAGDAYPGDVPGFKSLVIWGNNIVFAAKDAAGTVSLWLSDGTVAGTRSFYGPITPIGLAVLNNTLFFTKRLSPGFNSELWKSNGTAQGTVMVKRFSSDLSYTFPKIVALAGKVFFTVQENATGTELWISDGTSSGTKLVKDIYSGKSSSSPSTPVEWKGRIYFHADDGSKGRELWSCNSSGQDAKLIRDIHAGHSIATDASLFAAPDFLLFAADDGVHGRDLWMSTGTESGTRLLQDLDWPDLGTNFSKFYPLNDIVLFSAGKSTYETYQALLWKSDGSSAGTVPVTDKVSLPNYYPRWWYSGEQSQVVNNHMYFVATTESTGYELFRTDGTDSGTVLVKDITEGTTGTSVANMLSAGNLLYFRTYRYSGEPYIREDELWRSDGTEQGTFRIKDGDLDVSSTLMGASDGNGMLCFTAQDPVYGSELWTSDGSENGTQRATTISTSSLQVVYPDVFYWKNSFFFTDQIDGEYRLWKMDRNTKTAQFIRQLDFGLPTSISVTSISQFTLAGDYLYFVAAPNNSSYDYQLWRTDGTTNGTIFIHKAGYIPKLVGFRNSLYFLIFSPSNSISGSTWLCRSSGTPASTEMIREFPSQISISPYAFSDILLQAFGNRLYFNLTMPQASYFYSWVLWQSDGTAAGTARCDIIPGVPLLAVRNMSKTIDSLYFAADDQVHGPELWRIGPLGVTRAELWNDYR